ncbi:xanthine dehydrogenase accessory factor [Micromonospora pattaloongensis]|uniref:Xanthine dehydrogenase accessory factor n=1 Tax=Micromonospora pattaloongensis TaxID=405436 RepID=A0A1H3NK87_9ACTN|nr:XdhC/CoxI family protein [Micromonospora pattaloongensis]SDY89228.1 xanthine dehydrogenase accessory factor [Micromonospora pattaloongensis]
MRDVLDELERWWRADRAVALATVVATSGSAPRPAGATMLVAPDGAAAGSVSGGCVEAAVYELAHEVRRTGRPVLRRYGVPDDDAYAVGLTCGGHLDVYVERVDPAVFPELPEVAASIRQGDPVAVASCVAVEPPHRNGLGRRRVVWPGRTAGSLGPARLDAAATREIRGLLAAGRTAIVRYSRDGRRGDDMTLFVSAYAAPPRMIVFGAVDFASALARVGAFLGYRVTVCDARPVFATRGRFPDAHEVVVDWPHRYLRGEAAAGRVDGRSVLCVLTHDPKFDVPLLEVALRLPVAYVGAMGSRRGDAERRRRLSAAGVGEGELRRLAAPIGLDLGARTVEETAISIAAEIIASRCGGTGGRLTATAGPIHHVPAT